MAGVVERLKLVYTSEGLRSLTVSQVEAFLTEEERHLGIVASGDLDSAIPF